MTYHEKELLHKMYALCDRLGIKPLLTNDIFDLWKDALSQMNSETIDLLNTIFSNIDSTCKQVQSMKEELESRKYELERNDQNDKCYA